jgi:hypothetical protein
MKKEGKGKDECKEEVEEVEKNMSPPSLYNTKETDFFLLTLIRKYYKETF